MGPAPLGTRKLRSGLYPPFADNLPRVSAALSEKKGTDLQRFAAANGETDDFALSDEVASEFLDNTRYNLGYAVFKMDQNGMLS